MMVTKFLGFTITSKAIKTRIMKSSETYGDTRFIAQVLVERTTTFWKIKRITQKWHNVRRYLQGIMFGKTRLQDGFEWYHEAEEAIEMELQKMEFKPSIEIMEQSDE